MPENTELSRKVSELSDFISWLEIESTRQLESTTLTY